MPDTTYWNGTVWGTNVGTATAELSRDGNTVEGNVRLVEPGLGYIEAHAAGQWNGNALTLDLSLFTSHYSVPLVLPTSGRLEGTYDEAQQIIQGTWQTDVGTNGHCLLAKTAALAQPPVNQGAVQPPSVVPAVPAALVNKTVILRSCRLDKDALSDLAELVTNGTNVRLPAVNAGVGTRHFIHIGVDSLLNDPSVPAVVYDLFITVSEQASNAGNRSVAVSLKQNEWNTLVVTGYDRVWVEGKAAQIESFLQNHESKTTHFLRKYGSNVNTVVFLAMLALLPSIPYLEQRLRVVGAVFVLLLLLAQSWRLANTKVFLKEPKVTWYERHSGFLLVLLEVALAGFIAVLIARYVRPAETTPVPVPPPSNVPAH
jgi:hypothetical protein